MCSSIKHPHWYLFQLVKDFVDRQLDLNRCRYVCSENYVSVLHMDDKHKYCIRACTYVFKGGLDYCRCTCDSTIEHHVYRETCQSGCGLAMQLADSSKDKQSDGRVFGGACTDQSTKLQSYMIAQGQGSLSCSQASAQFSCTGLFKKTIQLLCPDTCDLCVEPLGVERDFAMSTRTLLGMIFFFAILVGLVVIRKVRTRKRQGFKQVSSFQETPLHISLSSPTPGQLHKRSSFFTNGALVQYSMTS